MKLTDYTSALRFGRSVAATAMFNVATVIMSGIAGVIISRSVGAAVRGEYAAIMAWFGVVLVLGQIGQTAAITFFVAQHPIRAREYLATSRALMMTTGTATLIIGIISAPLLSSGDRSLAFSYRLMFATCLVAFIGASYTFSLQATDIYQWNLTRILQPTLFIVATTILMAVARLNLTSALWSLSATVCVQTVVAYGLCRRLKLTGGRASVTLAKPMTRYGLGQMAAMAPTLVIVRLDQLVLSLTVVSADLGHYAVAASLTGLAVPLTAAIGNVAFPHIASRRLTAAATSRLHLWALLLSAGVGVVLMLGLASASAWLVPALFGSSFRAAVPLVWLLAPGGLFLACGQVCGDLLRGHGRPLAVARAAGAAAVATVVLLTVLLPLFGVYGAAIASSAAAGVAVLIMLFQLQTITVAKPESQTVTTPPLAGHDRAAISPPNVDLSSQSRS